MARYAIIRDGLVENVIELNEGHNWPAPEGCVLVQSALAGPGWIYANGAFSPPVPVVTVPASVTPRQMRLALLQTGLMPQVTTYAASLSEAAQIEWEYATSVDRTNPLIAGAAAGLGMTEAQVDGLFLLAATF